MLKEEEKKKGEKKMIASGIAVSSPLQYRQQRSPSLGQQLLPATPPSASIQRSATPQTPEQISAMMMEGTLQMDSAAFCLAVNAIKVLEEKKGEVATVREAVLHPDLLHYRCRLKAKELEDAAEALGAPWMWAFNGSTLLHRIVAQDAVHTLTTVVKETTRCGGRAEVNVADAVVWMTPLHIAISQGSGKMVVELLQLGAEVDALSRGRDNCFHFLAKRGDKAMVDDFIAHSKITNELASLLLEQRNCEGHKPVFYCTSDEMKRTLNAIAATASQLKKHLTGGCQFNLSPEREIVEITPVELGMAMKAMIKHRIRLCPEITATGIERLISDGKTEQLAQMKDKLIPFLLDPTRHWIFGKSLLHYAAEEPEAAFYVVSWCMKMSNGEDKGIDFDVTSLDEGSTPLHCALQHGSINAAKALLHAGANPTLTTKNGDNCLHLCACNIESLKVFVEFMLISAPNALTAMLETKNEQGKGVLEGASDEARRFLLDVTTDCSSHTNTDYVGGSCESWREHGSMLLSTNSSALPLSTSRRAFGIGPLEATENYIMRCSAQELAMSQRPGFTPTVRVGNFQGLTSSCLDSSLASFQRSAAPSPGASAPVYLPPYVSPVPAAAVAPPAAESWMHFFSPARTPLPQYCQRGCADERCQMSPTPVAPPSQTFSRSPIPSPCGTWGTRMRREPIISSDSIVIDALIDALSAEVFSYSSTQQPTPESIGVIRAALTEALFIAHRSPDVDVDETKAQVRATLETILPGAAFCVTGCVAAYPDQMMAYITGAIVSAAEIQRKALAVRRSLGAVQTALVAMRAEEMKAAVAISNAVNYPITGVESSDSVAAAQFVSCVAKGSKLIEQLQLGDSHSMPPATIPFDLSTLDKTAETVLGSNQGAEALASLLRCPAVGKFVLDEERLGSVCGHLRNNAPPELSVPRFSHIVGASPAFHTNIDSFTSAQVVSQTQQLG